MLLKKNLLQSLFDPGKKVKTTALRGSKVILRKQRLTINQGSVNNKDTYAVRFSEQLPTLLNIGTGNVGFCAHAVKYAAFFHE
jgi:hypothetical protein